MFAMPPLLFLFVSSMLSLRTSINLQKNIITTEKVVMQSKTSKVIFFWAVLANIRRIGSIVAFFTPSFGLFNILFHWKSEQIPFK